LALEPLGREQGQIQTERRAVHLFLDQLLQLVAVAVQKAGELLAVLAVLAVAAQKVLWVVLVHLGKEMLEVAVIQAGTRAVAVGLVLLVLV
jgi:hypothetical protein